ncbi:hypothetical protein BJX63DRAFT_427669 [Aspergillus granulosus]|uniref:Uncharacterized protein n=1 Tax=Aspergillus granulosus TaxID=176169 RepID=A0ABR4I217_9EURO
MNTVESSNVGYLKQYYKKSLLLFQASKGCAKTNAKLSVYLDAEVAMDSTYAYYLSGTLVPPALDGTYAYFGAQPSVYLGVTVQGSAQMQYTSERKPLDLYGQIKSIVQISGTMSVGAKYTFDKAEVYWPQDADEADYSKINDLIDDPEPVESGLVPEFSASVQASADLDILVTPEANIGINVGGSSLLGGVTLVDAQVAAFVNSSLRFHADASAIASGDSSSGEASYSYNYGVYLLYNIGFGGHASIPFYSWYMAARNLFDSPKSITLYENGDVGSTNLYSSGTKRSLEGNEDPVFDDDSALDSPRAILGVERVVGFDSNTNMLWGSEPSLLNVTDAQPLRRRDDDSDVDMMDIDDDEDPDFSLLNSLTCPPQTCVNAGSANPKNLPVCGWTLPDLRYNCKVFTDRQIVAQNGQSGVVQGICTNKKCQNSRRSQSCPSLSQAFTAGVGTGYCSVSNYEITSAMGLPEGTQVVSCDEFPIASSKEGGNFYPKLDQNPTAVAVTCAPVYQQTLQGACNKIVGTLKTDVDYAANASSTTTNWQGWNSEEWVKTSNTWQRLAYYKSVIPVAFNEQKKTSKHIGYYHKRNFTLSLADPSSAADKSWGQQSLASYSAAKVSGSDATQVACAVNIFDQTQRYGFSSTNGLCLTGAFEHDQVYGNIPVWVGCTVQFTGTVTTTNSKRDEQGSATEDDSIGEFGGWKIKKIIIPRNPDIVVPANGYIPDSSDMLPVEYE